MLQNDDGEDLFPTHGEHWQQVWKWFLALQASKMLRQL